MAWVEHGRGRTSKAWRDEDNPRRRRIIATKEPLHYESVEGSGNFDRDVNLELENVPGGYAITTNRAHYSIQVEDGDKPAGTIGFGADQGKNWVYFKLVDFGLMNWAGKEVDGLGPANFDPNNIQIKEAEVGRGFDGLSRVNKTGIKWTNLWTTVNGGSLGLELNMSPTKVRFDVIVDEVAREDLEAMAPKGKGKAEGLWMGGMLEVDGTGIPALAQGGKKKIVDDLDDSTEKFEFLGNNDELLAFMPFDYCYSKNPAHGLGNPGRRPLTKRLMRTPQGDRIFFGLQLSAVQELLPGPLVFDPAVNDSITVDGNDCYVYDSTFYGSGFGVYASLFAGLYGSTAVQAGFRFTFSPNPPQNSTWTAGGDSAVIRTYMHYGSSSAQRISGTPNLQVIGDADANAPVFSTGTEAPDGAGFVDTTATVTGFDPTTDASNGRNDTPDIGTIVEEINALANLQAFRVRIPDSTGANDDWIAFGDTSNALNTDTYFDGYYTAPAAGGANPKGAFGLPINGPLIGPIG